MPVRKKIFLFSEAEVEYLRMRFLADKYKIFPVEIDREGIWNDGYESVRKIKEVNSSEYQTKKHS